MKPTEAKEWIDEAVSLGASREKATELLNAYTTQLGAILSPVACAATMALLRSMREEPEVVQPEPPPVEIPRRVVLTEATVYGVSLTGEVGTLDDVRDGNYYIILDDRRGVLNSRLSASQEDFVELKLTKTEQARLLLEKLSREAWGEKGIDFRTVYMLGRNGAVQTSSRPEWSGFGVSIFPTLESAESARDTIIRAGLAWWGGR